MPVNRKGSRDAQEPGHLVPPRVGELGQKQSNISRTGSEADSLLDLYGRTPNGSNVNVNHGDHDVPENMYGDEDDPDGWIHRDKLARIESQELQAAGMNLPTARRQTSMNGRKSHTADRISDDAESGTQKPYGREDKRQRISSPLEEEDGPPEQTNWDLRSPEEIAAEEAAQTSPLYINPVLRKSGSRIPVLTSSPLPIPQEHIERETPLPRSRAASGNAGDSQETTLPRLRKRGNSASSQVLLDDGELVNSTPTPTYPAKPSTQASPTKSKTAKSPISTPTTNGTRKTTPTARKPSNPVSTGPATGSATSSPAVRPGTRTGDPTRPRTAINRPEGDPPWLATMYKPDPRLPPDQQIIPTHAKRQQQAQWAEAGAIPNTYDREFSPLAVHTENGLKQPTPPAPMSDNKNEEANNAWPLKPMLSVRSTSTGRPGTSGSGTAGYSTMPKVITSPPIGRVHSPGIQAPNTGTFAPTRMQQLPPPEDLPKDKEKSCGCCVVM